MEKYRVCAIGGVTQLLLDDHIVDDIWMIRRVPEMPVKYSGNPLPLGRSAVVLFDSEENLYKAWYDIGGEGEDQVLAYAVSNDGIRWETPDLGIVEREGTKKNNLIDTRVMKGSMVWLMKDTYDSDPGKRYKCFISRDYVTERSGGRLFAAYSADGIEWNIYPGERSIMRNSSDGNGGVVFDAKLGKYVSLRRPTIRAGRYGAEASDIGFPDVNSSGPAESVQSADFPSPEAFIHYEEAEDYLHRYLRTAPYLNTKVEVVGSVFDADKLGCNRRIARAESDDFINWTEPEVVIRPDELDPPRFYGIDVVIYRGMYIGFLQVYNMWGAGRFLGRPQEADTIDLQLVFSRDGKRWERLANRPVFIQRGLIGAWDAGMIVGAYFIDHCEEIDIFYGGYSGAHSVRPRWKGIGLARLPMERLVARSAGDELGVLMTKPFKLEGNRLEINADASRGLIKIEVTDPLGTPLEGFHVTDCGEIRENNLRIPVAWKGDLKELAGRPVRLRFYMHRAKLYSFTFESQD